MFNLKPLHVILFFLALNILFFYLFLILDNFDPRTRCTFSIPQTSSLVNELGSGLIWISASTSTWTSLLTSFVLYYQKSLFEHNMMSQAQSNNPANGQTETTKWLQTRFESLFTVSSSSAQPLPPHSLDPSEQADFRALFFSTFSEDAKIVRNHQSVSVDGWLGELVGKTTIGGSAGGRIEWRDIVENTVEGQDNVQIVAGLFVVTRNLHIRIRAGPMQRLTYNTFSAKIEPMTDAIKGTQRRITELWITSVDKAAPIHLRGIPLVQQQQEGDNSINPELLREQH